MLPVWWHRPVNPAFRRMREYHRELEANLNYIERPCLEKQKEKKKKNCFSLGKKKIICLLLVNAQKQALICIVGSFSNCTF